MTLAGWKRSPGTEAPPSNSVAPIVGPTPAHELVAAELAQAERAQPATDVATFKPAPLAAHSRAPVELNIDVKPGCDEPPVRPALGHNTHAAAQDLERALAELDGPGAALLRGASVAHDAPPPVAPTATSSTPEAPAGTTAPFGVPVPFGVPPAQPAPFGAPAAFGGPAAFGVSASTSASPPVTPPVALPSVFGPSGVLPAAFGTPTFVPNAPLVAHAQQPVQFVPAGQFAPGVQFAPGLGAVPPVYTSGQSNAGKTVAIVIVIVIGALLLLSVMIIGAVSLLGQKVQASFNTVGTFPTISNTLPTFGTDPYAAVGSDGPNSLAAGQPFGGLTSFEASSGVLVDSLLGRNTDGPVMFPGGEGCVVFEPDTMSYGAFQCGAFQMNAQLVVSGTTADVTGQCQSIASERSRGQVEVASLWIVDYSNGQAECFLRTPEWVVLYDAGLPITDPSDAIG